ncbi:ACP S-malonyltransferase [Tengunoibacter tsumagoiensis]|uniref:ACP S-malonyltransferase n=1 Tax=Tengunoibacter tsumagoiensis TaxID=2014871 RepID=UPI0013872E2B|nr:ACP S-malonyltransferase [Tengunoibacter tsumagoiensis]
MASQLMYLFPGVGSHHSGMGKTLYEQFPLVQDLFTEASDILHRDIAALCFSSAHAEDLNYLENSQAALLCVSVATYRVLVAETGLEQALYLGYSLGEYSALCCAGALAFKDALQLVWNRGIIVSEVAKTVDGSMVWVVNVAERKVEEICQQLRQEGESVSISAYDSPQKVSISGTRAALRKAGERIVAAGGIPIPIKMSGPFHSPLMSDAAARFRDLLHTYSYASPRFPVISNYTAQLYQSGDDIPANLQLQLVQPIRWQASLELARSLGVTTSVEIGPKNVLTYLLEKNEFHITTYELNTTEQLQKIKASSVAQSRDYPAFLAKCLTLIVGTKNYNEDVHMYETIVIPNFRKIEATYMAVQAGNLMPDEQLYAHTLTLLTDALRAKKLKESDIHARLQRLG